MGMKMLKLSDKDLRILYQIIAIRKLLQNFLVEKSVRSSFPKWIYTPQTPRLVCSQHSGHPCTAKERNSFLVIADCVHVVSNM